MILRLSMKLHYKALLAIQSILKYYTVIKGKIISVYLHVDFRNKPIHI